ncbi:MAG TPA: DNA alkylation repair protein, partial [Candidatus Absconditabacterales bacterium]|nr:DNA alkylation repair protein [Candidatus Absconditabacterales bacterium]
MFEKISKEIRAHVDPEKQAFFPRFFKTGKGEYGEGDIFLGVTVPQMRTVAKQFLEADFSTLQKLLASKFHEDRLVGLFILVYQYQKKGADKKKIIDFYLANLKAVNNWDLVDATAPALLGDYLIEGNHEMLFEFARSDNLWKKRISIISTLGFIRKGLLKPSLLL